MRRFYQESWQGIPFTAFSHISFFHLAEPRFYAAFYEELFRRYKGWDDLPAPWRATKRRDARWLAGQLRDILAREPWRAGQPAPCLTRAPDPDMPRQDTADAEPAGAEPVRVLSIGSGVGYMEHLLLTELPGMELHVNEPSTVGMKWLRRHLPAERIYIGLPPACLPSDIRYDMIYLSAVDYGIPTRELVHMLGELRAQLAPGGELICLSASLLEEDSFIGSLVNALKIVIRGALHYLGIRRQQFWGWRRTRREYHQLFRKAGFANLADGWLDDGMETYWIRGFQQTPPPDQTAESSGEAVTAHVQRSQ